MVTNTEDKPDPSNTSYQESPREGGRGRDARLVLVLETGETETLRDVKCRADLTQREEKGHEHLRMARIRDRTRATLERVLGYRQTIWCVCMCGCVCAWK